MNDETAPQMIGDYEILAVLGAGGMGKVYKVRNVISDRVEAMKVLLPDLAGQKELADRFLREIKLLASLSHPNIAALSTAFTAGNQLVMIMEFVEGTSLAARLQQGPIPVSAAVDYIDQALAALSYAHDRQIIHRDIKPANMMVTPQGVLKLMDFGIAKSAGDRGLTMTGTTLGSLYYMSPEQIKGEAVDTRSDLYSVAVSLYEMVTGRRPFQAESNYSIMAAHLEQAPKPPLELQPELPPALNQLILMGLAKDPGQRFQSANAFRTALKSIFDTSPKTPDIAAASAFGATAVFAENVAPSPSSSAAGPVSAPAVPPATVTVPYPTGIAVGSQGRAVVSAVTPAPQTAAPKGSPPPPEALAAPPPVNARKSRSYRGLYMTLGAMVVVIVLVLGGLYVPRFAKTRASTGASQGLHQQSQSSGGSAAQTGEQPGTQTSQGAGQQSAGSGSGSTAAPDAGQPASNGSTSQPTNPSTGSTTDGSTNPTSGPVTETSAGSQGKGASAHSRDHGTAASSAQSSEQPTSAQDQQRADAQPGGQQAASSPQAAPAQANSAALDDLEKQLDALSGRAGAVKDSIDRLRQEQAAQGVGLRSDIATAEEQMETYMGKAQAALQNQDAQRTKRYMDLAEAQVVKLEKFLGH